jgi:hypothetical protein
MDDIFQVTRRLFGKPAKVSLKEHIELLMVAVRIPAENLILYTYFRRVLH